MRRRMLLLVVPLLAAAACGTSGGEHGDGSTLRTTPDGSMAYEVDDELGDPFAGCTQKGEVDGQRVVSCSEAGTIQYELDAAHDAFTGGTCRETDRSFVIAAEDGSDRFVLTMPSKTGSYDDAPLELVVDGKDLSMEVTSGERHDDGGNFEGELPDGRYLTGVFFC